MASKKSPVRKENVVAYDDYEVESKDQITTMDESIRRPKKRGGLRKDLEEFTRLKQPYCDEEVEALMFIPNEEVYEQLMEINDIEALKEWISMEYGKICGYDYFKRMLAEFLWQNDPDTYITESSNPAVIITAILKYFDEIQEKFRILNLTFGKINVLEGSELGKRAEDFATKMIEEMERNIDVVKAQREELQNAAIQMQNLLAENKALKDQLAGLRGENLVDIPLPKDFLTEMQVELQKKENLQSSMLEEIERERFIIQRLQDELFDTQKRVVAVYQEKLDEIAGYTKDIEVENGIKELIAKRIKKLNPDPLVIVCALNDWMRIINQVISEKQEDIEDVKQRQIALDDEVAEKDIILENLQMKNGELDIKISKYEDMLEIKSEDSERLKMEYEDLIYTIEGIQNEIEQLKEQLADLDEEYIRLSKEVDRKQYEVNVQQMSGSRNTSSSTSSSIRSMSSPQYMDRSTSRSPRESPQSPEIRRFESPDSFRSTPSRLVDQSTPVSLDSSGSPHSPYSPHITVTPPSPAHSSSPESFSIPHFSGQAAAVAPGTQTISRPQSKIIPTTQTISGVRNRFDVGKGISMQTVTKGSPEPYYQATRVSSTLPHPGTSRMADASFSLKHRAELTPSQFVTPFISTTRFGYTDPTAKVLNLPPGDDLDIGTSLRKTMLLTSPYREQPLILNIDVDPKPLTLSASGEHFICDISLDVQHTGEQQAVFSYGVPPAITPTTARRHTPRQHTPRGIFKKKHFNVRKLYGPDYESPDMPSHYLPFDARSPITGFPLSPYYEDRSISWEKSSDFGTSVMDRTFDAPGPSAMNRTFDGIFSPAVGRTFDKSRSPILNKTFDRSPSPVLGRTFHRGSPAALDRTYDRIPSPALDRIYDKIPSPALDRTYGRSPSPPLDRTYDSSPSRPLDRTYDSSPSPVIKRPFYADSSSGMSESPVIKGQFYGSRSPPSSSSPVIKRKFDTNSPSSSTYDRSPSPLIKGKVYTYGVPPAVTATTSRRHGPFTPRGIFKKRHYNIRRLYDSKYLSPTMPSHYLPFDSRSPITGFPPSPPYYGDKSMSWERSSDQDTLDEHLMNLTSDESPSPHYRLHAHTQGDRDSPSPLIKGPYYRKRSPASDTSSQRSESPVIKQRFDLSSDSSPSPDIKSPHYQDPSPRLDRTFDSSPSPIIKRPYYGSPYSDSSSSRSVSPMINRTFDSSPGYDSSFDKNVSSRLDATFDSSGPSGLDGTFDKSSSSERDKTFDRSPQLSRTYDRSDSPQLNRSDSPQMNKTSPPNTMNRTFDSHPSSLRTSPMEQQNRTFDSHPSYPRTSPTEQQNRTFENTPSDQNGKSEKTD